RQPLDELVRLRGARRALDLFLREVATAERDVLPHGGGEEERILGDDADLATERRKRHVANVDSVEHDAAMVHVVEAGHERRQRWRAAPGRSTSRARAAARRACRGRG